MPALRQGNLPEFLFSGGGAALTMLEYQGLSASFR